MERRTYESVVLGLLIIAAGAGAFLRYERAYTRPVRIMTIPLTGVVHTAILDPSEKPQVNINTATLDELDALPGVSRAAARRIIERRAQQPFNDLAELIPLLHMSERRFAALAAHVFCGPVGSDFPTATSESGKASFSPHACTNE